MLGPHDGRQTGSLNRPRNRNAGFEKENINLVDRDPGCVKTRLVIVFSNAG